MPNTWKVVLLALAPSGRRQLPLLPLQPPVRTVARLADVGVSRTGEREHEWQRRRRRKSTEDSVRATVAQAAPPRG